MPFEKKVWEWLASAFHGFSSKTDWALCLLGLAQKIFCFLLHLQPILTVPSFSLTISFCIAFFVLRVDFGLRQMQLRVFLIYYLTIASYRFVCLSILYLLRFLGSFLHALLLLILALGWLKHSWLMGSINLFSRSIVFMY